MTRIKPLLTSIFVILLLGLMALPTYAQDNTIPLRVEAAATGELTAANPTAVFSFNAYESLRMSIVFDVISGDMQPVLTVFDQDGKTILAGATGTQTNGVTLTFPSQGTYYATLSATGGTSATYRIFIDADPPQPINAFILQSYLMEGLGRVCSENTLTTFLSPTSDLNVCVTLALVDQPSTLTAQWWTPSGQIASEESYQVDDTTNFFPILTGVSSEAAFEQGWWQVHFLLNGELIYIQWVPVFEV